ncbi:probable serine/threonine-protein kinase DDB_G0271682 [Dendronephthya gigantea]|uniref:probable serine/threonine-protein kinase DDB_G0271682 n=1 Tax=Dendronephthya gigantea TaxID=151771 RepID=UPI00106BC483|nr:probable serine/threonine-protein kinase DDB_G0271682 [Dendronephthya gigantea]
MASSRSDTLDYREPRDSIWHRVFRRIFRTQTATSQRAQPSVKVHRDKKDTKMVRNSDIGWDDDSLENENMTSNRTTSENRSPGCQPFLGQNSRRRHLHNENEELRQEIQELKKVVNERGDKTKELSQQIETLRLKNQTTEREKETFRQENIDKSNKIEQLQGDKIRELQEKIAKITHELADKEDEIGQLQKESNEIRGEVKELQGKIESKNRKIREHEEDIDQIEKEVEKINNECAGKEDEIEQLREDKKALKNEMETLRQKNVDIKNEIQQLQNEVNEMKSKIGQLQGDKIKTENTIQQLQKGNNEMKNEIQQHWDNKTKMENSIQKLQKENNEMKNEIQQLRDNKTKMENSIQKLQKEKNEVENEIQLLRNSMGQTSSKTQQLQTENNAMSHEIRQRWGDKRKMKYGEIQQRRENIDQVKNEIQRLQEERNEMSNEIKQLRKHIDNVTLKAMASIFIEEGAVVVSTNDKLGEGTYGAVYKGDFHGSKVAVKEFHKVVISDYNLKILQREVYIASQCRHPNLLQFICATRNDQNRLLIVTEMMDTTLRTYIEERASPRLPLKFEELKLISLDVACGLNYLHSMKPNPIVHRDISSANVMLWIENHSPRRAKISYYGSATFMVPDMSKTVYPSAFPYAAPEAWQGKQDPKMNVFSYGILVCEMSTCEQLGSREYQTAEKISNRNVKQLVNTCTKPEPRERPTMQDVIELWKRYESHDTSHFPFLQK